MAQLQVYTLGGSTPLGTLTVVSADWLRRANEFGAGRARVAGTIAASLLAEDTYIRVNDGIRDVFAFLPLGKPRSQHGAGTVVDLAGPGVRWIWTRALIYPESESDDRPVQVRWFGPMSLIYVPDGDWTDPVSFGRHDAFPFGPEKGPGFADRSAELVSYTSSRDLTTEESAHRAEFTLAEDTEVVIQSYGDDYYRTFLDAAPLDELETQPRAHNWKTVQEWRGTLAAGDHVLYFEFGNIVTPNNAGDNPLYIAWSVMRAAGDGSPRASHHAVTVAYSGTSGYWQAFADGTATAQIAWDATQSTIEAAFNDALGDGEVTVAGSTGSWTITFDGPTTGYTPHAVSVDGTVAGLSLQTASYGASAEYIAHSDASTGKVLPHGSGMKGLTPHQMWAQVISEEQAKGDTWLDHVQLTDTTATLDSDGNAWPELVVEVPLDNATGDRLNELLIEAGIKIDMTPDLVMQGWGGIRGTDRSATVAYTVGDGCRIATADHDASSVLNVLRWISRTGWDEEPDAASIAVHGRAGEVIRLDTYDDDGVGQFTPQLLADLKDPQEPVSIEVPSSHPVVPGDDYDLADVISAPAWATTGLVATDVRVLEIGGRVHGAGHLWTIKGTS